MSSNYKFHNSDGLYFVSFSVVDWLDVFTRIVYKDIVVDSLIYCQKTKGMEIMAWCIMTNHGHLIFRSISEEPPSKILGDMKRFTSKAIIKSIQENPQESRKDFLIEKFKDAAKHSSNVRDYQFWQHDNHPIELWSNNVIRQKLNYLHQNPVKAGIVFRAEDYVYSSAVDYAGGQGLIPDITIFDIYF